jgi:hypothetical protein
MYKYPLLNGQPEQTAAKSEQQADTGAYGDNAHCLGMLHQALSIR